MYPIRCQLNDSNAVSTTSLLGKHSYFSTPRKCLPGHCDRVPTSRVFGHLTHRMITTVYTRLMVLLVKYKPVVGMQNVANWWTLTCVTFIFSTWEKVQGQYLYKCTAPTTRQVSKSGRSLPSKAVEAVRKLPGPLLNAQLLAYWSNTPVVGAVL